MSARVDRIIYHEGNTDAVQPGKNHTILYEFPVGASFKPFYSKKINKPIVQLPFYETMVFTKQAGGGKIVHNNWPKIKSSLKRKEKFESTYDLENAMFVYNKNVTNLISLHEFFANLSIFDRSNFLIKELPKIVDLALSLPTLIKTEIPILKKGENHSISLTQLQIASLLANAFFCTFTHKEHNIPDINFTRLFQSEGTQVVEKINCIINYFKRVCREAPRYALTFTRRCIKDLPKWSQNEIQISSIPISLICNGKIEDEGKSCLQVDFANKYIGGGVLGRGCVQEEILFVIFPELIVSRLFTECLNDNEALIMIGAERFSDYIGYASSFKFKKNHVDETPCDKYKRRLCHIVAIDAMNFGTSSDQYHIENVNRELNKAFIGFMHRLSDQKPPFVASGNWGCGAFRGNPKLKVLLQLMACAKTNRGLYYFTFGDERLLEEIQDMYNFLSSNQIKTKELWKYITAYDPNRDSNNDLFRYIKNKHQNKSVFREFEEAAYNNSMEVDNAENFTSNVQTKIPTYGEVVAGGSSSQAPTNHNSSIKLGNNEFNNGLYPTYSTYPRTESSRYGNFYNQFSNSAFDQNINSLKGNVTSKRKSDPMYVCNDLPVNTTGTYPKKSKYP